MINLTNRTEYSFRVASGRLQDVIDKQEATYAGICDRAGTWGHKRWSDACKEAGIRPIFGAELATVRDCEEREKQPTAYVKLIAKNQDGLAELYELVTLATEKFYYEPRTDWSVLGEASDNLIVILPPNMPVDELRKIRFDGMFGELSASADLEWVELCEELDIPLVACNDNYMCNGDDEALYQSIMGRFAQGSSSKMHILSEHELRFDLTSKGISESVVQAAIDKAEELAKSIDCELKEATLVEPERPASLEDMCREAAPHRGIDLSDKVYEERMMRELELIAEKDFEDYFYLVGDLVRYAKQHMLVGPARGSSCGSLVCYLLDITDIDPIPYDLLFERFIDVNRMDYPDIDIDFADDRRDMVYAYLQGKYGHDSVAKLGTISLYKSKSAITEVSKQLKIPSWEIDEFKESIMERSGGDARAELCIMDAFHDTDIGKATIEKYPELAISALMEGHARHAGIHAAGIVVTKDSITNYCAVNEQNGAIMLDKHDAEALGLLKIDVLGLRTLSVIQDCLDQAGWSREKLIRYRTDDQAAFDILNDSKFSGIFQFEGQALQNVTNQMGIQELEDIIAVTALARPGPLISGGTKEFVARKLGNKKVEYIHPSTEEFTKVTYGVIVYQEQVMRVCREIGRFSWADTSTIRKCMSKTMGKEFFDQFFEKFREGAASQGINAEEARVIWDNINTMGSWAFNRSHAVAYGIMSYWCCVLKAHHPLEWAAACLRHAKDDRQSVHILRDLVNEGYSYVPKDKDKSGVNWIVEGNTLIGPLTGIKGIGPKMAESIVAKRKAGKPLTPRQDDLLVNGITPWDVVFEAREKWQHVYDNPTKYNIKSKLWKMKDIQHDKDADYVFLGKIVSKTTADANEVHYVKRRNGRRIKGQTKFMKVVVEDDTDTLAVWFNRQKYLKWGKPLIEEHKEGDWFVFKGNITKGIRMVWGDKWMKMSDNPKFEKEN